MGTQKFRGSKLYLITQDAYDFFQLSTWLVCFCLILVVFQVGRPLQEGEMFESTCMKHQLRIPGKQI